MKLLFLFFVFCLMLSVQAQREVLQYTCLVTHENQEIPFYLIIGQKRYLEMKNSDLQIELKKVSNFLEFSLSSTITTEDGVSGRVEKRLFPINSKKLTIELKHLHQAKEDHFGLECVPRGF